MSRSAVRAALLLVLTLALLPWSLTPAGQAAPPTARVVTAIAGEPVRVAGAVPQRVRRPVLLQRRDAGHWRTVSRARTTKAGRFGFSLPRGPRRTVWSLRGRRPGTSGCRAGPHAPPPSGWSSSAAG